MQEKHPKAQQGATGFVEHVIALEQRLIEALVYAARSQGFRAGVRPYIGPQEEEEGFSPISRAVFIEYPEKTVEWPYGEVQAKFLDSLPQYES